MLLISTSAKRMLPIMNQPIETALKDGRWIYVQRASGQQFRAAWLDLPSMFRSGPQWWSDDFKLVDVPLDPIVTWTP